MKANFKKKRADVHGVQYVVNNSGKKVAVLIDLDEWGDVWEDIYDVLVSESRKDEPAISWQKLKLETSRGGRGRR